jgi:hypothetical protein
VYRFVVLVAESESPMPASELVDFEHCGGGTQCRQRKARNEVERELINKLDMKPRGTTLIVMAE